MNETFFGEPAADAIANACLAAKHEMADNPWLGEDEAWLCEDCEATIDDILEGVMGF